MTKDQTRNDNLREEEIREIAREETSVEAPNGDEISLKELIDVGLDRERAIGALGLIALGAGVGAATQIAMGASSGTASAQSSSGSGEIHVDKIIANLVDSSSIETDSITGGIVGRSAPIDHLSGNIYVSDTEPSSPDDDDIWFDVGSA